MIDGTVARWTNSISESGARFDTVANTIADAGISTDFPASLHVNISNNAVCFRDAGFLPVFAASLHKIPQYNSFCSLTQAFVRFSLRRSIMC